MIGYIFIFKVEFHPHKSGDMKTMLSLCFCFLDGSTFVCVKVQSAFLAQPRETQASEEVNMKQSLELFMSANFSHKQEREFIPLLSCTLKHVMVFQKG